MEGGAIYVYDHVDTLVIDNCLILGNRADKGAGLYADNPVNINDSIIAANFSQNDGAGFYIYRYGVVRAYGCSIVGNTAGGSGGGMFAEGFATFYNCILWDNRDIPVPLGET